MTPKSHVFLLSLLPQKLKNQTVDSNSLELCQIGVVFALGNWSVQIHAHLLALPLWLLSESLETSGHAVWSASRSQNGHSLWTSTCSFSPRFIILGVGEVWRPPLFRGMSEQVSDPKWFVRHLVFLVCNGIWHEIDVPFLQYLFVQTLTCRYFFLDLSFPVDSPVNWPI